MKPTKDSAATSKVSINVQATNVARHSNAVSDRQFLCGREALRGNVITLSIGHGIGIPCHETTLVLARSWGDSGNGVEASSGQFPIRSLRIHADSRLMVMIPPDKSGGFRSFAQS